MVPPTSWSSVSVAPRVRARSSITSSAAPSPLGRRVVPDHETQRARDVRRSPRPRSGREARAESPPPAPRATIWYSAAWVRSPSASIGVDVERDLDPVLAAAGLPSASTAAAKPWSRSDDRLEVEGEIPELADRRPRAAEGAVEDLARLLELATADQVERRVEHQRDAGERLHRAVVEEERDAPPLVLLRGEDLLGRVAGGCDERLGPGAGRRVLH